MLLIFDFDGTIADSGLQLLEIINQLAGEFDFQTVPVDEIEILRGSSTLEMLQRSGIPLRKLPAIVQRTREEITKRISEVKPFEGIIEVLQRLKLENHALGILTNNTAANVQYFLESHRGPQMDFIHTSSHLWGKARYLKRIIRQYNRQDLAAAYIGDETRDVRAARKAGLLAVAVTWGYQNETVLKTANPDQFFHQPQDILHIPAILSADLVERG